MALKSKHFRRPGGVIALPREMVRSPAYRSLSPVARALITELQDRWAPSRPVVHLSVREAGTALGISKDTASRALASLVDRGFIEVAAESDWLDGQSREYVLTWLSVDGREPRDRWRNYCPRLTTRTVDHQTVSPQGRSPPKPHQTVSPQGRSQR